MCFPGPGDYRLTPVVFSDLTGLVTRLKADDKTTPNGYVYRGQVKRHYRSWPPEPYPPIVKDSYTFDSLVSTGYRGIEDLVRKGKKNDLSANRPFSRTISYMRMAISWHAFEECERRLGVKDGIGWLQRVVAGGQDGTTKLGSISQHYGLQTSYVDATEDWRVALWFASHEFGNRTYMAGGKAFIYQITIVALEEAERRVNAMRPQRQAWEESKHVSIKDTPANLAPRASGQKGLSLVNFEHPFLLAWLVQLGGIKLFECDRPAAPSPEMAPTSQVVPSGDPMPSVYNDIRATSHIPAVQRIADDYINYQFQGADQIHITLSDWELAWADFH